MQGDSHVRIWGGVIPRDPYPAKTLELAVRYNDQSIEAITNVCSDLISFWSLCYLLFALEIQINVTKSFLLEVFFGLDDSKKSLFILFLTDLLVGYHSPNIWELFFSQFHHQQLNNLFQRKYLVHQS